MRVSHRMYISYVDACSATMRYMSRRPCWKCCADGSPRHGLQWGVGDLAKRGPVFRHAAPRPFNALTDRAVWDVVARRPVCHVSAQCRSVTEHWQRARGQWCGVGRVASTQQLEEARARRHGDAHDDGLAHPHNVVHRAPACTKTQWGARRPQRSR